MSNDPAPLHGVRVLDLSRLLPGPYCSCILADYGAEVIKIEPPGGSDWMRYAPPLRNGESILYHSINRGKKSLTLDLKSEEGWAVMRRLVGTADVLLEGFRPGVMERLGLGYDALAEVNPRLVYCALTGYGLHGPYRQRAGHDLNYIGLAGLLELTGRPGEPPVIPGTPVADITGALWAAIGILLALAGREQTGRGQRVDATLLGGALACLPVAFAHLVGGQPIPRGRGELSGGVVCYNVYPTADGGYVSIAALEPEFWAAFCQVAERADLLPCQFDPALPGEPTWESLCTLFRRRTRVEWAELLAGVDACCEPVYSLVEALDAPPLQALGMQRESGLLFPLQLSDWPAHPVAPAPALGQHNVELLAELEAM